MALWMSPTSGRSGRRSSVALSLPLVHVKGVPMKVQGSIEFTITERGPDQAVSEMPIQPGIKNPFGVFP